MDYMKELQLKFKKIKKLGYIKSKYNGCGAAGLTFESLLGKTPDFLSVPDFCNIELKTKIDNSHSPIHLFSLAPKGLTNYDIERIWKKYGYPGIKNNNLKMLNVNIKSNSFCCVGSNYYFVLKVNYIDKKVNLLIYDKIKRLVDNISYWDFNDLEVALFRKLSYLAIIDCKKKIIGDSVYYYYYKLRIYRLKGFKEFINSLNNNHIIIKFGVSECENNEKQLFKDRGTSFDIYEKDIQKLFYKIKSIS